MYCWYIFSHASFFTFDNRSSPAYQYEASPFRNKYYRHVSEGGWPFSTAAHGWPISDCTGEGLKAILCLLKSDAVRKGLEEKSLKPISDDRLFKAANILLTYQNEDGGKYSYSSDYSIFAE
jgi:squalene cyclase